MTTILVGECAPNNLFELWDPDATSEAEFEFTVGKALMCVYPNYYYCILGGSFRLDEQTFRPDLAMVAKDFSHWFVIEIELTSHSFDNHVLPQARAFRYGEPLDDCISALAKGTGQTPSQIRTLLRVVPRSVAVIANKPNRDWEMVLRSHQIQFLSGSVYRSPSGQQAVEISGRLEVMQENIGFGVFLATDRTLRFHKAVRLPEGEIQISDPDGGTGLWVVTRDEAYVWVTKAVGAPDLMDGSQVQLIRAIGGRLSIRRPINE